MWTGLAGASTMDGLSITSFTGTLDVAGTSEVFDSDSGMNLCRMTWPNVFRMSLSLDAVSSELLKEQKMNQL